jgi:drug/metabolite transporter (DMT)-like permease
VGAVSASAGGAKPWIAFAACGLIWGSTFLVIDLGNDALAPVWAAALRLCLATALLGVWMVVRRIPVPRGGALTAAIGHGICQFAINFPLLYWGERHVPSGMAAVLYATVPLSSALMVRAMGLEPLTLAKVLGAATALAGVAVLFSASLRGDVRPVGLLTILFAANVSGLGVVLLKRGPRQNPIGANAVGCAIGAVVSLVASTMMGEPHRLPTTFAAAAPVLYLTVAGSLGAFVLMSWLVNHWPVTRTSYVSIIVPVIALALGAVVRGQTVTATAGAGCALILAGLLIGMRRRRVTAPTS